MTHDTRCECADIYSVHVRAFISCGQRDIYQAVRISRDTSHMFALHQFERKIDWSTPLFSLRLLTSSFICYISFFCVVFCHWMSCFLWLYLFLFICHFHCANATFASTFQIIDHRHRSDVIHQIACWPGHRHHKTCPPTIVPTEMGSPTAAWARRWSTAIVNFSILVWYVSCAVTPAPANTMASWRVTVARVSSSVAFVVSWSIGM